VKGFRHKVIFGLILISVLFGTGIVMMFAENSTELYLPMIFVFAFGGGVVLWLSLNARESKRRREENYRRKNR